MPWAPLYPLNISALFTLCAGAWGLGGGVHNECEPVQFLPLAFFILWGGPHLSCGSYVRCDPGGVLIDGVLREARLAGCLRSN